MRTLMEFDEPERNVCPIPVFTFACIHKKLKQLKLSFLLNWSDINVIQTFLD